MELISQNKSKKKKKKRKKNSRELIEEKIVDFFCFTVVRVSNVRTPKLGLARQKKYSYGVRRENK
jgi:hypothetical protein